MKRSWEEYVEADNTRTVIEWHGLVPDMQRLLVKLLPNRLTVLMLAATCRSARSVCLELHGVSYQNRRVIHPGKRINYSTSKYAETFAWNAIYLKYGVPKQFELRARATWLCSIIHERLGFVAKSNVAGVRWLLQTGLLPPCIELCYAAARLGDNALLADLREILDHSNSYQRRLVFCQAIRFRQLGTFQWLCETYGVPRDEEVIWTAIESGDLPTLKTLQAHASAHQPIWVPSADRTPQLVAAVGHCESIEIVKWMASQLDDSERQNFAIFLARELPALHYVTRQKRKRSRSTTFLTGLWSWLHEEGAPLGDINRFFKTLSGHEKLLEFVKHLRSLGVEYSRWTIPTIFQSLQGDQLDTPPLHIRTTLAYIINDGCPVIHLMLACRAWLMSLGYRV